MNALAHYYAAAASAFHEIFYNKFPEFFFAELFRKSTVIFPEISGNFRTHNPTRESAYLHQVNFYRRPLFEKKFKGSCPDCPWKYARQI